MRHAESDHPPHIQSDYDRPLTERGMGDTARAGDVLRERNSIPQWIFASSARRAHQTATGLVDHLELSPLVLQLDSALYLASPASLLQRIEETPEEIDTVLIIAHNPGMEELIYRLSGVRVTLPPAGLATLHIKETSWLAVSTAKSRLAHFFIPNDNTL